MDELFTTDEAVYFGADQPTENSNRAETAAAYYEPIGSIVIGLISAPVLFWNVLVILFIIVLKDYRKTTHWYVLNLAIADSLFLMLLPLYLVQNVAGKWTLGLPACVAFQGGFYMNYYAGVLFLGVMSFDCYVAIAHPVSKAWRKIRSKMGSLSLTIAVWFIAIVCAVPLMAKTSISSAGVCDFSFDYIHPECVEQGIQTPSRCELWRRLGRSDAFIPNPEQVFAESTAWYTLPLGENNDTDLEDYQYDVFTSAEYDESSEFYSLTEELAFFATFESSSQMTEDCFSKVSKGHATWIIGNFVLSFILPLTVMACCYRSIIYQIYESRILISSGSDNRAKVLKKKVRITILVVSLVVVFVVCWSPLHVVALVRIIGMDLSNKVCYRLKNATVLIAYSSSLLNPVMYTFVGINSRKELKTAISRFAYTGLCPSLTYQLNPTSKKCVLSTVVERDSTD